MAVSYRHMFQIRRPKAFVPNLGTAHRVSGFGFRVLQLPRLRGENCTISAPFLHHSFIWEWCSFSGAGHWRDCARKRERIHHAGKSCAPRAEFDELLLGFLIFHKRMNRSVLPDTGRTIFIRKHRCPHLEL